MNHLVRLPIFAIFFFFWSSMIAQQSQDHKIKVTFEQGIDYNNSILANSNDGKFAVSAGHTNFIINLWDLEAKQFIRYFKGHRASITSLNISDNSRYLLSGSNDGEIICWNLQNGHIIARYKGHKEPVSQALFSLSFDTIFSSSYDRTVRYWHRETGQQLKRLRAHQQRSTALTAVSHKLNDELVHKESYQLGGVTCLEISPDGKYLLSGGFDKRIRKWEIRRGKKVNEYRGHLDTVNGLVFLNNGDSFVSSSKDGSIKIWHDDYNVPVRDFVFAHPYGVTSLDVSPDGKRIISSGFRQLKLWDLESLLDEKTFDFNSTIFTKFTNNQAFIYTGSQGYVYQSDVSYNGTIANRIRFQFNSPTSKIKSLKLSPSGKRILIGGDMMTRMWDLHTNKISWHLLESKTTDKIEPIYKEYYFASNNNELDLVDASEGKQWDFIRHKSDIEAVAVSPDHKWLVTGDWSGNLVRWDIKKTINNGENQRIQLSEHTDAIRAVDFSDDSKHLLSAGNDNTINLWNNVTGELLQSFKSKIKKKQRQLIGELDYEIAPIAGIKDLRGISSIDFLSDNNQFLTGDHYKRIQLWNIDNKKPERTYLGHYSPLSVVKAINDGEHFLSGSFDGELIYWKMDDSRPKLRLFGHVGKITSICLLPDTTKVLTSSEDHTIRLWDLEEGKELATMVSYVYPNYWIVKSPDGHYDASSELLSSLFLRSGSTIVDNDDLTLRYHEPKLLQKLLGYNNERLKNLNVADNPIVNVNKSLFNSQGILEMKVIDRGGGIGPIKVSINDREVNADFRDYFPDFSPTDVMTYDLKWHPYVKDNQVDEIKIETYSEIRSLANPTEHKMHLQYEPTGKPKAKLYAMVCGISNYDENSLDLQFAAKDAQAFAESLKLTSTELFGPENVEVRLLTTDHNGEDYPNKSNMRRVFEEFSSKSNANDVLLIYLSGHGTVGHDRNSFYYLLPNVRVGNSNLYISEEERISYSEIATWLNMVQALKKVTIIDACNSGNMTKMLSPFRRGSVANEEQALEKLFSTTGSHIITGSAKDKVSYEASEHKMGLLTYSLLLGMKGAALSDQEGQIDVARLFEFSRNHVPKLAQKIGISQLPLVVGTESFPIGIASKKVRPQIHLPQYDPVFVPSKFHIKAEWNDPLDVQTAVDQLLKSKALNYEFYANGATENSYLIAGGYTYDQSTKKVKVNFNLFYGKEKLMSHDLTADQSNVAQRIVSHIAQYLNH
ncbi:MAG: caspase family protein [Reichenbachiella sp.]|uniref:caspase family protein n=1 Tax=Reichenbachiella sp. TaxID=2184521 RepID=UPI003267595A